MGVLAENDDDEGESLVHPNDDGTSGPNGPNGGYKYAQARALPPLGLALAGNGDGVVFVVEVVPDSVADESGIEAGDQLLGVGYMPLPQLAPRARRTSAGRPSHHHHHYHTVPAAHYPTIQLPPRLAAS